MTTAPVTITAAWCPSCDKYLRDWEWREDKMEDVAMACFTCLHCGAEVCLEIARDELNKEDRSMVEVVK